LRIAAIAHPLKFDADFGHNYQYNAKDPPGRFGERYKGDTDYYVGYVSWGSTSHSRISCLAMTIIGASALNSPGVEGDWVRWSNQNQAWATNMKGRKLRVAASSSKKMIIIASFHLADAMDLLSESDIKK